MVDEQFVLLCNPYPIFKTHLTISTREHRPQLIKGSFGEMLKLSKALDKFTLFYNGPECGASAPDHFHFQAGNRGFLPIENEIGKIEFQVLVENPEIKVISSDKSLRRFFVFESNNAEVLSRNFLLIYTLLQNWAHSEEPMLNVLCNYIDKKWRVIIFPREKQRPSAYYEKGEKQILVSPASVELGGVIILPRKADFDKITKPDIRKIYDEVTINRDNFDKLNQIIQILVGE
jgi:ATP adenylyltransferase/5',5'''-P-1,P-4-tetraphosphate phosphorylase II